MAENTPQTLREYLLREAQRWDAEADICQAEGMSELVDGYRENAARLRADAEAAGDRVVVRPECDRCIKWDETNSKPGRVPLKSTHARMATLPEDPQGVGDDDKQAIESLQHHLNTDGRGLPWKD